MSIRGRGPHTVYIQRRKVARVSGMSGYVDDGPWVLVDGVDVQSVREWSTSEEYYENGLRLLDLARLFARDWVGDENSIVWFDGGCYETVGKPQHRDRTPRTRHWVVTLRWLRDESLPQDAQVVDINEVLEEGGDE